MEPGEFIDVIKKALQDKDFGPKYTRHSVEPFVFSDGLLFQLQRETDTWEAFTLEVRKL